MITLSGVGLSFGGQKLFDDINLKFTPSNCYGVIGANGAGKSSFLKILSGELESTAGSVHIASGKRMAVLKQDHFAYEEEEVLKTVIMGHGRLSQLIAEKDALYAKGEFSEEDGLRASDLEAEFAELNGWEAEADASTLLAGLGVPVEQHQKKMKELSGDLKVKVLLAQALFGKPDILLLDEPTNHLDLQAIRWLENFLLNFDNTVLVVSHDRYFLNKVCTRIVDIDFGKIQVFVGNYDFWYESSQLALKLQQEQNKKSEEKIKDLKAFITRFSANASKSKQATSRQKMLDKITLEDIKPSSRRYPFIRFTPDREAGNELLRVDQLSFSLEGRKILNDVSFIINKGEKVAFTGPEQAITTLFSLLMEEIKPEKGSFRWGVTTARSYLPKDPAPFFSAASGLNLLDWLRQYSVDQTESFIRGLLGRMLFSGDEPHKKVSVLSGGEKMRCLYSKMMVTGPNVLVLDGPTNHLDLESITALNNGLIGFPGTILMSSHDHQLNQTVATRIIEIHSPGGKGIAFDKQVTFDEYLELKLNH